jgi:rhodanese-related sulfurtransferase
MKASTRKRLEVLEQAASMHETRQLVIIDVRTFSDVDREAYRTGDDGVLRRYGAPDPDQVLPGQIHTIVIDVHPVSRDNSLSSRSHQED